MNQGVLAALRTILARKPRSTDFEGYYGRLLQSGANVPTADEARRDVQQQRSNSRTSYYGL